MCSLAWVKIFDKLMKAGMLEQVGGAVHARKLCMLEETSAITA
jgi:hypothetical protein